MREGNSRFFSVTYTTALGRMRCVPQVCYRLASDLRAAVEDMAGKGLARIYTEEVRFVSGAAYPVKTPAIDAPSPPRVSSAPAAPGKDGASKKSGRKGQYVGQTGKREFD